MADLDAVLEQLKRERKRAEGELKELGKVITALSRIGTKSSQAGSGSSAKRQLSAAARERIAAAQRARGEGACGEKSYLSWQHDSPRGLHSSPRRDGTRIGR